MCRSLSLLSMQLQIRLPRALARLRPHAFADVRPHAFAAAPSRMSRTSPTASGPGACACPAPPPEQGLAACPTVRAAGRQGAGPVRSPDGGFDAAEYAYPGALAQR